MPPSRYLHVTHPPATSTGEPEKFLTICHLRKKRRLFLGQKDSLSLPLYQLESNISTYGFLSFRRPPPGPSTNKQQPPPFADINFSLQGVVLCDQAAAGDLLTTVGSITGWSTARLVQSLRDQWEEYSDDN